MGIRHQSFTSDSPTQVWYRELANGDIAVALYNKNGSIAAEPCDTWNHTTGGYLEACGETGNIAEFNGLTADQAQTACCANPECAGFSYNPASRSGYYKANQDCGFVSNSKYEGYSKPSVTPTSGADITLDLTMLGYTSSESVEVYDIWAQKSVGTYQHSYTAKNVPLHGSAFLRLSGQVVV